jgi:predicted nucleotide-binding protein (sugar kinase/HSP70/actin superfamily)|tara:strand:+ start:962 stop:1207 length:246 start_codon:yes stop_codon:yes gene_type:complete
MSKKQISEGVIDKVIEKLFTAIAKGTKSNALRKLKKNDPELARDLEFVEKKQKDIRKRMIQKYGSYANYEKAMFKKLGIDK